MLPPLPNQLDETIFFFHALEMMCTIYDLSNMLYFKALICLILCLANIYWFVTAFLHANVDIH